MKNIKYQMMTEVNHGTEENPDIVQTFNLAAQSEPINKILESITSK